MISTADYLRFVGEALDGMEAIVIELGDELANQRPDIPGTNTPYALLTHCLGVMEHWGGHVVAGRTIVRDRAAEFRSSGSVTELVARSRRARQQLVEDLAGLDPSAPPRRPPTGVEPDDAPAVRTQGGALIHIYEELSQHRGHMEVTRDVLLAPWAARAPVSTD